MKPNVIIFCHEPGRPTIVDSAFAPEADAARAAGFEVALIDHDAAALVDVERALRRVPAAGNTPRVLYRGWMLSVPAYTALANALTRRGYAPITSAGDYAACHHITGWLAALDGLAPQSRIIPHTPPFTDAELDTLLAHFAGPAIIKDYVKSEKHAWHEACFIPDTRDRTHARRLINRFIELRGHLFEGGLTLREFVPLRSIGTHPQSGMPLSSELRSFWSGTRCLAVGDYWQASGKRDLPAIARTAADRINRPFYTIDIAQRETGDWIVMEVGDAQVSGLADDISPQTLFDSLSSPGP